MTAVEYLVSMICTDVNVYDEEGNDNGVEYWNAFTSCKDLSEYIKQAKELEKEQIIDAYYEGKEYGFKEHGEQYYNETFKK
jgi:hypothetical protein